LYGCSVLSNFLFSNNNINNEDINSLIDRNSPNS
jgi:hypothetical protein